MVSGLLALLVATSPVTGPTPDTKATVRYKVDLTMTQKADLTAAGQGVLEGGITSTVYVTLTTSDTTGGTIAHFVIDSMTVEATGISAGQMSQTFADSLAGETIHAYIVDGKVEGSPELSDPSNPAMNVASQVVGVIYPGVGPKARDTKAYSDTVTSNTVNDQGTRNSQQIVDWTVTGAEGNALMLTGKGAGTVSADMNGQQISGSVATTMDVTSPIGGPASKALATSDQDMMVLVPGMPEPISVKVETRAELTQLP